MKRIVIVVAIFLAFVVIYFMYGYPILLNSNQNEIVNISDTTEVKFNPINDLDFSTGNNVAYLFFSKEDIKELPEQISKYKILECEDNEVLQNLRSNFWFEKTGGDMATCESKIYLYQNGELVFYASIVLKNNSVGIQSIRTGWANASDEEKLKDIFLKFKPVKRPILNL